jgi:lecithin:retinol acyltransferase
MCVTYFGPALDLAVGDLLRVTDIVNHYGIYVGDGYVIHNEKGVGVRLVSLDDFAAGRDVYVDRRVPPHAQDAIRDIAFSMIGTPYDLLRFNCEHFVNLVYGGDPTSAQARVGGGVAALLAAWWFLSE